MKRLFTIEKSVVDTSILCESLKKLEKLGDGIKDDLLSIDDSDEREKGKIIMINPSDLEFSPETRRICKQIDFDQKPIDILIKPSIIPSLIIIDGPLNSPLPSCKSPELLSFSKVQTNSPRSSFSSAPKQPAYLNYKGVQFSQSPIGISHHFAPITCSSLNTWILSDGAPNFSKRACSENVVSNNESGPAAKRANRQKEPQVFFGSTPSSGSVTTAVAADKRSILSSSEGEAVISPVVADDEVSSANELESRVREIISEEKVAVDLLQSRILSAILAKSSSASKNGGCSS